MEQKNNVHNVITEKVVLTTESPPEIWVWRFRSKQAAVKLFMPYCGLFWTVLYSRVSTVQYSTEQYSTVQHNTAQHSTTQYNTIQDNAVFWWHSNCVRYNGAIPYMKSLVYQTVNPLLHGQSGQLTKLRGVMFVDCTGWTEQSTQFI